MKVFCCSLLLFISVYAQPSHSTLTLDDLKIEAIGPSQPIVYTNGVSGTLFTETKAALSAASPGWRVMGKEMMKDYALRIDGVPLRREDVVRVLVYPHQFTRTYRSGLEETVTMLDSVNAFIVQLNHVRGKSATVYPLFSDVRSDTGFTTGFDRNIMLISRNNHPMRTIKENYPAVLALTLVHEVYYAAGVYDTATIGENFCPAYINTVTSDSEHTLVVAVGDSGQHAYDLIRMIAKHDSAFIAQRKVRTEHLINALLPPLTDADTRTAFAWGIVGTDQLLFRENTNNTFLTLPITNDVKHLLPPIPGSGLILGSNEKSASYLRSLSALQDADSSHATYGQILSKSISASTSTSSLNITPWFTLLLDQYVAETGDTNIVKGLYPTIQRGIEGALKFQVGKDNLLTLPVVESQLNALAPFGMKKSEKGTASAVQALWLKQLSVGVKFAKSVGDVASAERWQKFLQKIYKSLKI